MKLRAILERPDARCTFHPVQTRETLIDYFRRHKVVHRLSARALPRSASLKSQLALTPISDLLDEEFIPGSRDGTPVECTFQMTQYVVVECAFHWGTVSVRAQLLLCGRVARYFLQVDPLVCAAKPDRRRARVGKVRRPSR